MSADCTSLAPGTQWSHNPMVRLPAALALRTNGAARPRAAPPATTLRREIRLVSDMACPPWTGTLGHTKRRLLFLFLFGRSYGGATLTHSFADFYAAWRRHRQEARTGWSARAWARSSRALISGASSVSPRRARHSCRPCRLQTLSGCQQARLTVLSKPRSA